MRPTKELPARCVRFTKKYPDVAKAYEALDAGVNVAAMSWIDDVVELDAKKQSVKRRL